MPSPDVSLPEISISPAPPQESPEEPYSPFAAISAHWETLEEPDSPRPTLLSPPTPYFSRQLSPLRPDDVPVTGQGLERERFEAMLRASRERNAAVGGKKSPDLRKEIAIKVHKTKQVERRALFLAKLKAPPSPTATHLPKTPPESPAIFHFTLPSPGLESPLVAFETMILEDLHGQAYPWVEQVDFRLPSTSYHKSPTSWRFSAAKKSSLPSLEQITAHLQVSAHGNQGGQLPYSLRPPIAPRRGLSAVGRLQFPSKPVGTAPDASPSLPSSSPVPSSPVSPKLQVTTTVVPRISSPSPDALTSSNLLTFAVGNRERKAQDMLVRIRQRTTHPSQYTPAEISEQKKLRRHSAPPELPSRERIGFSKPVLDLPGAF